MATCSIFLAWEIPWTEEPVGAGLQSMGLQRFGNQTIISTRDIGGTTEWLIVQSEVFGRKSDIGLKGNDSYPRKLS